MDTTWAFAGLTAARQAASDFGRAYAGDWRPGDALGFAILYLAISAILHAIVYRSLAGRLRKRCALTTAAIDLSSILQFAAWIPLGLVLFDLGTFYLFLIPTLHEIYDVAYILGVHRRRFAAAQVRFVLQHHLISPAVRVAYIVLLQLLVPVPLHGKCMGICLAFYSCSIFLIAPSVLEPLFLGAGASRGKAWLRTLCFAAARISHAGVLAWLGIIVGRDVEPGRAASFLAITAALVCASEYHNVMNGLPRVRQAWRGLECGKAVFPVDAQTVGNG